MTGSGGVICTEHCTCLTRHDVCLKRYRPSTASLPRSPVRVPNNKATMVVRGKRQQAFGLMSCEADLLSYLIATRPLDLLTEATSNGARVITAFYPGRRVVSVFKFDG